MLPHVGQGANQAIEDGVALAAVLSNADRATAPHALQVYAQVRQPHTARVQSSARDNGARYDAASSDLTARDVQLSNQARDRAWMWNSDPEAEATALAGRQRQCRSSLRGWPGAGTARRSSGRLPRVPAWRLPTSSEAWCGCLQRRKLNLSRLRSDP